MKRRRAVQAILGTPLLTRLPLPAQPSPQTANENPKLTVAAGDAVGEPVPRFFTPAQMATLKRLGEALVPAAENRPGALQAQAPEFLDFLLAQSPRPRQVLYGNGLDRLQTEAGKRYNRRFEELTSQQVDALLEPLHEPWTYRAPADSFRAFLRAAREDLLLATVNSREYAAAQTAAGRRASGMGTYWYPVD